MSDNNNSFKCELCDHFYSSKFSLRRHLKVKHPPKKSYVLCETCGESLPNGKLLNKHMETHEQMKNRLKCPLCGFVSQLSTKLNEHIKSKHRIEIEEEILEFKSSEEFLKWKLNLEKSDTSKFVKYCGNSKIKDGSTRSYYYCHRSYVHKPHVLNRMKKMKKQGLTKIGAHCPASMKVLLKKDGAITVHYIKTHLGHERELCYINLSIEERKYLASLISKNMSFDEILNDIKKQGDFNHFGKLNFVTRADLHNIRRSFHLYHDTTSMTSNQSDLIEIDVWVKQQLMDDSCCVLLYKSEDAGNQHYPHLPITSFFLAIMTKDQEAVLLQQQFTCVCMDIIQSSNINERRFELVTLSVLNNSKQEFPTAFLVTSQSDLVSIETFLTLIKNKVGIITVNIFMSNMKDCCYDVWCKIMTIPNIRLYSSWNVNRKWRTALQKIITSEDENFACKIVKELTEEKDKQLFCDKMKTALESLCSNKKTRRFGQFFKQEFGENVESWAQCFRQTCMETDIQLERIHRSLKYLFITVKTLKRLDKSIIEIKKFLEEKFFNKVPAKELKIAKMREIDSRHRASLRLNLDCVAAEDHGWVVISKSRAFHSHIIRDISPNCNCSLICVPCKVCVHRFCCSCNDSSVMWRMCKHIHLVCRAVGFTPPEKENHPSAIQNERQNNKDNENISCDTQLVNQLLQVEMISSELDGLVDSINISGLCPNTVEDTVEQKKSLIKRKFTEIMELVKTENEANLLQTSLDLLHSTFSEKTKTQDGCATNLPLSENFPPPLVLLKPNSLKINNYSFNPQQITRNQYDWKGVDDPIPSLVPLRPKKVPKNVISPKEHIAPQPLAMQIVGLDQESPELITPKTGNVLILMNKFCDVNNG